MERSLSQPDDPDTAKKKTAAATRRFCGLAWVVASLHFWLLKNHWSFVIRHWSLVISRQLLCRCCWLLFAGGWRLPSPLGSGSQVVRPFCVPVAGGLPCGVQLRFVSVAGWVSPQLVMASLPVVSAGPPRGPASLPPVSRHPSTLIIYHVYKDKR
jgi:hypothetical protein